MDSSGDQSQQKRPADETMESEKKKKRPARRPAKNKNKASSTGDDAALRVAGTSVASAATEDPLSANQTFMQARGDPELMRNLIDARGGAKGVEVDEARLKELKARMDEARAMAIAALPDLGPDAELKEQIGRFLTRMTD